MLLRSGLINSHAMLFYSLALYVGEAPNYQERMKHTITGRRFSFTVLIIAFTLGSFNTIQLLPTMNEREYSQAGYFTITNQDRSRQIWNEEPVVYYEGRPNPQVESETPNNVTLEELRAWKQVLMDYLDHLSEIGIKWSGLGTSPLNGTIELCVCDLTEEKVHLFVDTMKHYVPMGVMVLVNATIEGHGFLWEVEITEPGSESPLSLTVSVKLNKDVFDVNDKAQLIITNRGSKEVIYGSPYYIERLEGEEWVEVSLFPSPYAWTAVAMILPPKGTNRQEIKIDTLEPGHYRVHKKIDIEAGEATFTLEFEIRGEG